MTDSEKESMKKQGGGGGKPGVRKGKKNAETQEKKIEKSSWHRIGKKNESERWGGGRSGKKGPRERQKGRGENKETTRQTCWVHSGI